MAALQQKLKQAVADAQREALLAELLSNGDLTIGDLIKIKGELGDTIRQLSINELRAGGTASPGRAKGRATTKSTRGGGGGVDTRTGAGRREYQAKLLEALKGASEPMSAPDLRAQVGGTPDQARRALNRLIEQKKVTYTGKARGTRYRAKK